MSQSTFGGVGLLATERERRLKRIMKLGKVLNDGDTLMVPNEQFGIILPVSQAQLLKVTLKAAQSRAGRTLDKMAEGVLDVPAGDDEQ